MIKMLIEMDQEKIEREQKYDIKKIESYLDDIFSQANAYKDTEGYYTNGTFESFGAIIWHLRELEWFLPNVKKWLWLNSDSTGDPKNFEVEDVANHYKNRR